MIDLIDSLYTVLNKESASCESWSVLVGEIDTKILKKYNITCNVELGGVRIDFIEQSSIQIFKTKEDFYLNSQESDFNKKIIIIQEKLLFEPNKASNFIFDNVLYSSKLFNFFKSKISSHHDLAKRQLIFLSEKTGKNIIGYDRENETDLTKDLQLKKYYENIKNQNDDFLNFLKNSIISNVELAESQNRYLVILKNLEVICEHAKRDFELYQSKFSFVKFKKGLETEKAKYIQDIQKLVSDFSSKLHMPIEFGIHIVLIVKFSENFYSLIATMIIIVSWGCFRFWSNMQSLNNANYLEKTIMNAFDKIKKESKQDTKQSKKEINKVMRGLKNEIKSYMVLSFIFSIATICIACNLLILL